MGDVFQGKHEIRPPGTLKVGNIDMATEINEIIASTVVMNFGAVDSAQIVSASGTARGLTAAHKVVMMATSWLADMPIHIAAAVGIAGGIQATAVNASTASGVDAAQFTWNFFAWR